MNEELLRVKRENQELSSRLSEIAQNAHGVERQLLSREGD